MMCRALLAAATLAYLICVLVLSGVQKDDLDVGLLQKLQRHNVNIADMDNEQLRQQCLSKQNSVKTRKVGREELSNENQTTTEPFLISNVNKKDATDNNTENLQANPGLETVLKYIKTNQTNLNGQEKSLFNNYFKDIVTTPAGVKGDQNIAELFVKKYSLLTTQRSPAPLFVDMKDVIKPNIEHDEDKPSLETILKFWQMFKHTDNGNKTIEITNTSQTKSLSNKDNNVIARTSETIHESLNNIPPIEYDADKLRLDSALQLWKTDMKPNKNYVNTEIPERTTYPIDDLKIRVNKHTDGQNDGTRNELKENIEKNIYEENKHITKLIAEYMDKKDLPPITQLPLKPKIDSNKVGQLIDQYLANYIKSEAAGTVHPKNVIIDRLPKQNDNNNFPNYHEKSYKIINEFQSNDDKYIENHRVHDIRNVPISYNYQNDDSYKEAFTRAEKYYTKPDDKYIDNDYHFAQNIPKGVSNYATKDLSKLSPNVLKQIADSVKEIVLKDLRQDMTITNLIKDSNATTISTTVFTSTTQTTPTIKLDSSTIAPKSNQIDVTNVNEAMEKFIALFEEIKTMKDNILTSNEKHKMTETVSKNHVSNTPLYSIPMNSYTVNPPERFPPMVMTSYGRQQQLNLPTAIGFPPLVQNSFNVIPQIQHTPILTMRQLHAAPIMIQTNSNEIKPLRIPISQPMVINENIIVTTVYPYIKSQSHQRWEFNTYNREPTHQKITEDYNKRITSPHPVLVNRLRGHNIHQPRFDSRFKTRHGKDNHNANGSTCSDRERNIDGELSEVPGSHERESFGDSDNDRLRFRDDIRGYHERLERTEEWRELTDTEGDIRPRNVKLVPRLQMPLNTKMASRYDDTHFKNFLKTQQKVNDMLERILATKTKGNISHSVTML